MRATLVGSGTALTSVVAVKLTLEFPSIKLLTVRIFSSEYPASGNPATLADVLPLNDAVIARGPRTGADVPLQLTGVTVVIAPAKAQLCIDTVPEAATDVPLSLFSRVPARGLVKPLAPDQIMTLSVVPVRLSIDKVTLCTSDTAELPGALLVTDAAVTRTPAPPPPRFTSAALQEVVALVHNCTTGPPVT